MNIARIYKKPLRMIFNMDKKDLDFKLDCNSITISLISRTDYFIMQEVDYIKECFNFFIEQYSDCRPLIILDNENRRRARLTIKDLKNFNLYVDLDNIKIFIPIKSNIFITE